MGSIQIVVLFLFSINLIGQTMDRDLNNISNFKLFMHYCATTLMMFALSWIGFFG